MAPHSRTSRHDPQKRRQHPSAARHRVVAKPPLQGAHPRELLASPPTPSHTTNNVWVLTNLWCTTLGSPHQGNCSGRNQEAVGRTVPDESGTAGTEEEKSKRKEWQK